MSHHPLQYKLLSEYKLLNNGTWSDIEVSTKSEQLLNRDPQGFPQTKVIIRGDTLLQEMYAGHK